MAAVTGYDNYNTPNSLEGALEFLITQIAGRTNVCTPVKVVAVHTEGRVAPVGFVDVLPLLDQQTVDGEAVPSVTIFGVPYLRAQAGTAAIIVDPQVGDTGVCVFSDRDISTFKSTGEEGVPPTFRRFSMADAIYIGGFSPKVVPLQYVVADEDGVEINAGEAGTLSLKGQNLITQITGLWSMILGQVALQADSFQVTVPEFVIDGDLHVTGIISCILQPEAPLGLKYGGTGADLSSTGGDNCVLAQLSPGAKVRVLPISELNVNEQYTNSLPTPIAVGGIPVGSSFNSQTMTQMWNQLLYPYQSPSFASFEITGQDLAIEVGASTGSNPSFAWTFTHQANVQDNTIEIDDSTASVNIVTGASEVSPYNSTYGAVTKTTSATETFTITATNTERGTFSSTFVVSWLWRIFWGQSSSVSLSSSDILALANSELAEAFPGAYSFAAAPSEYKVFCIPSSMGTPTSFKDASTGFAVPFNAPYAVSVTNSFGVVATYDVYQSTNMLGGAVTVAIS